MTTQRITLERSSAFRRRRFVVPHRRRSRTLMLLKPFLLAMLLVGLPVVAALWLYTSPRFLLRQVQIGSSAQVSAEEIAATLSPLEGRHLLGLSLKEVEGRLTAHPWIKSAAIRKELPDTLVVQIEERRPAALLRREGELFYVDESGFVIGVYDPQGPVDLLLLSLVPGATLEVQQALEMAARPRIHTGLGVSDVHIRRKLRSSREQALQWGVDAVKYAKKFVEDVQYYAEQ